jgi:hypothetical protein
VCGCRQVDGHGPDAIPASLQQLGVCVSAKKLVASVSSGCASSLKSRRVAHDRCLVLKIGSPISVRQAELSGVSVAATV